MTVVQKNIGKKIIESNNLCINKQEEGGRVRPQAEGVRGAPGENYCFYSTNFPHNRQINIFFLKKPSAEKGRGRQERLPEEDGGGVGQDGEEGGRDAEEHWRQVVLYKMKKKYWSFEI